MIIIKLNKFQKKKLKKITIQNLNNHTLIQTANKSQKNYIKKITSNKSSTKPCTTSFSMSPARGVGGDEPYTKSSLEPRRRRRAPRRSCCDLHGLGADRGFTKLAGAHGAAFCDGSGCLEGRSHRGCCDFHGDRQSWCDRSGADRGLTELGAIEEARKTRWARQTEISPILPLLPSLPPLLSLFLY